MKNLSKKMKRDFVIELFGNRFMLKDNYHGEVIELNKTLGKIPIVFSDNEDVIKCYDNLLSTADDKNLLRLIKSMCMDRNVKIDISNWDDEMIMKTLGIFSVE